MDSIAAIQSIEKYNTKEPFIHKIQDKLHETKDIEILLIWGPSHYGIQRNTQADHKANPALIPKLKIHQRARETTRF